MVPIFIAACVVVNHTYTVFGCVFHIVSDRVVQRLSKAVVLPLCGRSPRENLKSKPSKSWLELISSPRENSGTMLRQSSTVHTGHRCGYNSETM